MKEKDATIDCNEHQLILYVEKKDGTYGPVQTGSYLSKKYIDDYWFKRSNLEQEYVGKVRRGEISPIELYMVLEDLTPSELAGRVNMSTRKVKKHLKPEYFSALSVNEIKRYCDVFNVPLINMFQAIITDKKKLNIKAEKSDNPLFTILKIEAGKK